MLISWLINRTFISQLLSFYVFMQICGIIGEKFVFFALSLALSLTQNRVFFSKQFVNPRFLNVY